MIDGVGSAVRIYCSYYTQCKYLAKDSHTARAFILCRGRQSLIP